MIEEKPLWDSENSLKKIGTLQAHLCTSRKPLSKYYVLTQKNSYPNYDT